MGFFILSGYLMTMVVTDGDALRVGRSDEGLLILVLSFPLTLVLSYLIVKLAEEPIEQIRRSLKTPGGGADASGARVRAAAALR